MQKEVSIHYYYYFHFSAVCATEGVRVWPANEKSSLFLTLTTSATYIQVRLVFQKLQ